MNLFTPYLPMYHKQAHPERPWWHLVSGYNEIARWERCDFGPGPVIGGQGRTSYYAFTDDPSQRTPAADILAELDRLDAKHPLPVPPPMPGQVWVFPGESSDRPLFRSTGAHMIGYVGEHHILLSSGPSLHLAAWPVPGTTLVLGPTPWGRDVPWQAARLPVVTP